MRELLRRNILFFIFASAAALLLRLIFVVFFPSVLDDSFIYGDIAKNWLTHGIYGISSAQGITPTYIRLPGYPLFLALIFSVFGMEHYHAVLIVQVLIDLATCLICADLALQTLGPGRAKAAFLLAALCPFLANYTAAALTETLEVFFTVLALDCGIRFLKGRAVRNGVACGVACACAILLRPDGALLLFSIVLYLGWRVVFPDTTHASVQRRKDLLRAAVLITAIAISPLIPWTIRNQRVFHRFQPLAPRYANEEGEFVPMGFNRWVKTWMADYVSVEEVYWQVPGSAIDVKNLPQRAFDSRRERRETVAIVEDYNKLLHISPSLDRRFEALAVARIGSHPLRYYVGLPMVRILDMWLRPRTEILPSDTRWWEFDDEPRWSTLAVGFGVVGLFYALSAAVGRLHARSVASVGLLTLFVTLRSAFLGTLENPEPRYTLEMYPVVVLFAAAALVWRDDGESVP